MNNRLRNVAWIFTVVGAALTLLSNPLARFLFDSAESAADLRAFGGPMLAAALGLLLVAHLAFDKAAVTATSEAWANARLQAVTTVRQRCIAASESVDGIVSVVRGANASDIPERAATGFDRLAQLCSGWISLDAAVPVWDHYEREMLRTTNRAVFAFLLTIESDRDTNMATLEKRASEAKEAIATIERKFSSELRGN